MEALIQGLAEESVSDPGWKFDADIQSALKSIRDVFVVTIQNALLEAHEADQNHFNCFVEECFTSCHDVYAPTWEECVDLDKTCADLGVDHGQCREEVLDSWKVMSNACGELCCFEPPKVKCMTEECLCNDLSSCTKPQKVLDSYGNCVKDPYSGECMMECPKGEGDCGKDAKFGKWLNSMIKAFEDSYADWVKKHAACEKAYHEYLEVDYDCDIAQRKFERCQCGRNACELGSCVRSDGCIAQCWDMYEDEVWSKDCLEKDRKIDWSATKKIECYMDVLLHDYTKEELLSKCGTADCINKAREQDYAQCGTICKKVDFNGEWPKVLSNSIGNIQIKGTNHDLRAKVDGYHMGDKEYKCDLNGQQVMTRHRGGGVSREGEERCTEHLDIDYQFPVCYECNERGPPVCDEPFHLEHYSKYDRTCKVPDVHHCTDEMCFGEGCLTTAVEGPDGKAVYDNLKFNEHSFAWAYNRCECVECDQAYGTYPVPPTYRTCDNMCGAHTLMTPTGAKGSIYGDAFDKKVTTQEHNGAEYNGNDADFRTVMNAHYTGNTRIVKNPKTGEDVKQFEKRNQDGSTSWEAYNNGHAKGVDKSVIRAKKHQR
jgi:hypothetical protein